LLLSPVVPVTYAGRLDPMAEGLVLLLVGTYCKRKDEFLGLDKAYTFEVLFGVATDSYDMLGLITDTKEILPTEEEIQKAISEIKNKTIFSYPPFSSKPVDGVPLFTHAKEGTLPEEMPEIRGEIKNIVLKNIRTENFGEIIKKSIEIIKLVKGDFRQEECMEGWQKFLEKTKDKDCVVATCEATVSSGIYIRGIAVELGKTLDTPALAYTIERTEVGEYKI
jgi:tRNA pseudouridine55 synthase